MTQYEFDNILEKYLAGTCTPEEEEAVSEWYNRLIHRAEEALPGAAEAAVQGRLWRKIRANTLVKKNRQLISWGRYGAVAASVALLLWIGWQGIGSSGKPSATLPSLPQKDAQSEIEVKNTSQKPQQINLEDGSLVILQPQSTLSYPGNFGRTQRTVYLHGEGYFQIKRDTTKPFQVFTGNLVTEVLGTSFFIKQKEKNGTVEVEVKSGRVSVYENNAAGSQKSSGKILTQNQKVTFRADTRELIPSIVEQPLTAQQKPEPEPSAELNFEDAPLRTVFARLEKLYFLKITLENPALQPCVFTGDLNGLPLFLQIELVCKSIGAQYEVADTHIVVKGKGCLE